MGFAAGFATGYKAVSDAQEREKKRDEAKQKLAREQAKEVKEQDATDYKNAVTTLESTREYKEKGRARRIEIMSSKDFTTPEAKAEELRSFNQDYRQGLEALNIQISQQMEGASETVLNKITPIANATLSNAETIPDYQKLTIGDKSIFVDDKSYEAAMENPNQYGIGKDGNLYTVDQDGKITNQKVAEGKNFDGIAEKETDPKKMWISEQLEKYPDADISKLNAEWSARQEAALQDVKYEVFEKKERYKKANETPSTTDRQYAEAVEQGYTGSEETWKAEQKAIGDEQGKKIATLESLNVQKNMLSYVIKKKVDKPSDLNALSKDEKMKSSEVLEQYARKNKQPLYLKEDEKMLSKYSAGFNNISYMDKNAKDFTGLIDSVVSSISEVTGVGDAEGVGMFKSTLKTLTAQKARAMQGAGSLSNDDIKAAGQAIGQSYLSDKSVSGKIRKHAEDVISDMEAIKNKSTTNKYAFELQYEPVIKLYKAIAASSNQDELEIVKKEDLDTKGASIDKSGNISFNIDSLRKKLKDKKDKRNK